MAERYAEMRATLPPAYVDYIETHKGWEGYLSGGDEYVVLWDKEDIAEYYAGYEMSKNLNPRWFAFGSNGGGEMLCFDLESRTDCVYMLPFIGMSNETAILAHESFYDLAKQIERSRPPIPSRE